MICYLEDYYKIEADSRSNQFNLNNHDELFVESEVLTKLENKYGELFRKLTTQANITLLEATKISDFIIQLKLRNPYWFENTINKYKDSWVESSLDTAFEETLLKDPRALHIPDDIKKMILQYVKEDNLGDPNLGKKLLLYSLVQRYSQNPERNINTRTAIIDCQWMLFETPHSGPNFITSDNPGFSLPADPAENLIYNTKFKDGFFFHLPISPTLCLVFSDTQKDNCFSDNRSSKKITKIQVNSDTVIHINNKAMQCLNKLLIASDDWYLSQIAVINKPMK